METETTMETKMQEFTLNIKVVAPVISSDEFKSYLNKSLLINRDNVLKCWKDVVAKALLASVAAAHTQLVEHLSSIVTSTVDENGDRRIAYKRGNNSIVVYSTSSIKRCEELAQQLLTTEDVHYYNLNIADRVAIRTSLYYLDDKIREEKREYRFSQLVETFN